MTRKIGIFIRYGLIVRHRNIVTKLVATYTAATTAVTRRPGRNISVFPVVLQVFVGDRTVSLHVVCDELQKTMMLRATEISKRQASSDGNIRPFCWHSAMNQR
jgi:hypothetical protein